MSLSNRTTPHVIKLGGSLLRRPGLVAELEEWLRSEEATPRRQRILIVGGGAAVDAVRTACDAGQIADDAAHWEAIDAMDSNTLRLSSRLKGWRFTQSMGVIQSDRAGRDWLLAAGEWLRSEEPRAAGRVLPIGWHVTSDSIAARVATVLGADLTLLKSAPAPGGGGHDLRVLAEAGYVDFHFPQAAESVAHVRLIELGEGGQFGAR